MKKSTRIVKRLLALFLVVLMSINTFGAVVSDNDGSAFITKAEFDSIKNDFQSQIDKYNTSIDNKIDGAISSYLAGISTNSKKEQYLMLYGGCTLGLLENYYSRPYVEGRVGGELIISSFVTYGGNDDWVTGVEWGEADKNKNLTTPTYLSLCFHRINAVPELFRYLIADYTAHNGNLVFDLFGYCNVQESLNSTISSKSGGSDNTAEGDYSIGLCEGVNPKRWELLSGLTSPTGTLLALCEVKCKNTNSNYNRGAAQAPRHNRHIVTWDGSYLTSEVTKLNKYVFVTNASGMTSYDGVRVRAWSGVNMTNSLLEPHTVSEFYGWGWKMQDAAGSDKNYHIKLRTASAFGYACGFGAYDRLVGTDYADNTPGAVPASLPHGVVPDTAAFQRLFKADVGDVCRVDNMYSSDLASVIKERLQSKIITVDFDGTNRDLAPLYLGLPLADVDVDDTVELTLNLLDASTYDIGFYIDGFDNVAVENSSFANAGCQVDGSSNHRKQITGPNSDAKIKIKINKKGILFLKYGARGSNAQSIQLPTKCIVTTNN